MASSSASAAPGVTSPDTSAPAAGSNAAESSTSADRRVIALPLEPGLVCLRGLSPKRLRFEVEYGLERGTSANAFLFEGGTSASGQAVPPVLVHPLGASFAAPFLAELEQRIAPDAALKVVVGHVNPNRVALLRQLAARWPALMLVASNPGARLLEDLWSQVKPSAPGSAAPESGETIPPLPLPAIDVVKQEVSRPLAGGYRLHLIPAPTPRWPGALLAFEERSGLLMSGKFFAAHLCSEAWAEANRSSNEEDRRYFYDCLMAPMARQVDTVLDRLDDLAIRTIAPGHGPAIAESWRSLLMDYRRWGEPQERARLSVALLFASAYGNTAAIADAIARGIAGTGVRVESINCEFAPAEHLLEAIRTCDAVLIGSPTLGGHAPTPIVSALGTLLAEGDRAKPVGCSAASAGAARPSTCWRASCAMAASVLPLRRSR
jgi:flavorubredoxin